MKLETEDPVELELVESRLILDATRPASNDEPIQNVRHLESFPPPPPAITTDHTRRKQKNNQQINK